MRQKERAGRTTAVTSAGTASTAGTVPTVVWQPQREPERQVQREPTNGSQPPAAPSSAPSSASPRTVRSEHLERTGAWRRFQQRHLPDAELIAVSWHDGERRVFRDGRQIVKVYRHTPAVRLKLGAGLTREHEVARHLGERIRGEGLATTHAMLDGNWEVLRIPVIEGETVDRLLGSGRGNEVSLLRALAAIVRTNLAGVAHGDVSVGNIIVGPDSRANLLDWGRAVRAPRLRALGCDVLGVGPNRTPMAFRNLVRSVVLARHPTGPVARIYARRWQHRLQRGELRKVVKHKGWIDRDIAGLLDLGNVWELGATDRSRSEASEPWGYELVGLHGIGLRGWETTWERVRPRVAWGGRRVLDLGPDAGFAATFARLEGATSSLVIAPTEHRIAAASALADSFEVGDVETRMADPFEPAAAAALRSGADIIVAIGHHTASWNDTMSHLFLTSDAHELLVEVPVKRAVSLSAQWQHHGRRISEIAVTDDASVILHARWRVGV